MEIFDYFALAIIALMTVIAIGVFVFLGSWPGRIARRRGHYQADAIAAGGWATLIMGGIFWPLILMWAYTKEYDDADSGPTAEG